MLDGGDGAKALDDFWPAFHQSEVHASPIMVDFDYDGVMDILLATNDGELLDVKDTVRSLPAQAERPCHTTLRQAELASSPASCSLSLHWMPSS